MSKFWSQIVKDIEPYTPGEQPIDRTYIKLNTNENPYPPSPHVLEAIKDGVSDSLRLYPDPLCHQFIKEIAEFYDIDKEMIFVGNGSDEVLAFSFLAFFNKGDTILSPDISYSFYPVYSKFFELDNKKIPLIDTFDIHIDDYQKENRGIVIANPNAPTGKLLPLSDIIKVVEGNRDHVVIIDEAYIDFGGESAIKLTQAYDNLLVIQTLSKSRSLAGMRLGFAIGSKELIEGLNRVKNSINSYTLDSLALIAGARAMKDQDYFEEITKKVIATREWTKKELRNVGFDVLDSKSNFVFASPVSMPAQEMFLKLKEKGILVRYFNKPRISEYLRISIGTDEEMKSVIRAVKEILGL